MDINLYLLHNQACLLGPVQSWIYQAWALLWARGGESWWSASFSRRKKGVFSQGPAKRLVGVCISIMTTVQQFLGQAQKKDTSWLERQALKQEQCVVGQGLVSPTASESQMKL